MSIATGSQAETPIIPGVRTIRGLSRARKVTIVAALVSLLALAACTGSSPSPSPTASSTSVRQAASNKPNIIFVLTDDLSTNLVQYMPHVVALEKQGTSFSRYFVVDSLCCPSRAAIFTGEYPHDDGVYNNIGPDGGYEAFQANGDANRSFALSLQKAGYQTSFMGKYLNRYEPTDPRAPGWSDWYGVGSGGYAGFNWQVNDNGQLRTYGSQPQDYLTDVVSDRADNYIRRYAHARQPFFMELATFAPHAPFVAAPRDLHSFPNLKVPEGPSFDVQPTNPPSWLAGHTTKFSAAKIARLDADFRKRVTAVQAVDRMIGRIETTLVDSGISKNTYLIFSSDNGFHIGEHRLLAGKKTAFDTDIRVPLVLSGPGVPVGESVGAITSSIDLAPTFDAIAGATPNSRIDGVNMLGLWHGDPVPATWQKWALVEHHQTQLSDPQDPDNQSKLAGDPPSYEAMRSATALYVEYVNGQREYYDLTKDPYENHNVAGQLSAKQRSLLHSELHALEICHGATQCQAAAKSV